MLIFKKCSAVPHLEKSTQHSHYSRQFLRNTMFRTRQGGQIPNAKAAYRYHESICMPLRVAECYIFSGQSILRIAIALRRVCAAARQSAVLEARSSSLSAFLTLHAS